MRVTWRQNHNLLLSRILVLTNIKADLSPLFDRRAPSPNTVRLAILANILCFLKSPYITEN